MSEDSSSTQNPTTSGKIFGILFIILWFGGILVLGIIVPVYFTMTQTGTAAWLIKFQGWITQQLSGTASWYPVPTGLVLCVIHIFVLLGIVRGISLLGNILRSQNSRSD